MFSKRIEKNKGYRYELYYMSCTAHLSIKIGVNKKLQRKTNHMGIA